LDDLQPSLIREYLVDVGSDLAKEAPKMDIEVLCRRINIAEGPKEYFKPKNIGLMLFCDNPQKFFPVAQIDVVEFEDEVGDVFSEKIFKGPIHRQVRDALAYLKNSVIKEFVRKVPNRAEADRFYNYPYVALEEILVNAVYHRSYEQREPIEVRVYPDRILVLSYPGPMPPLGKDNINKSIVTSHMYRNRRLGDFLKELHLTEGRCTGFPKIRRAMKNNGSPAVVYETDKDRLYFMATIKIHPRAKETAKRISSGGVAEGLGVKLGVKLGVNEAKVVDVIKANKSVTIVQIAEALGISTTAIENNISKLREKGILRREGSDKTGHWEVLEE